MTLRRAPTPVRLGRAGVVLLAALLTAPACRDRETAPRTIVLGTDTLVLPDTIDLIDVRVGGEAGAGFEPPSFSAHAGDIVRFVASDGGTHAVAFDGAALQPVARDYLEHTGQLRGPPLLAADAVWIISLAGAPPGVYPFTCVTHGSRGRLTIQQSE